MRRPHTGATVVLIAAALLMHGMARPAAGQVSQRGYSSRGINSPGSRSSLLRAPSISERARTRANSATAVRAPAMQGNVNPEGPLSFGMMSDFAAGFWGMSVPFAIPNDMVLPGELLLPGELMLPGDALGASGVAGDVSRPNVRPRLDTSEADTQRLASALRHLRERVRSQLARRPALPFTDAWYAAHPEVAPMLLESGQAWQGCDWERVQQWLEVPQVEDPPRFDYRPDRSGLIFVYRNGQQLGRAVDARAPAMARVSALPSMEEPFRGLSLGVFAMLPPRGETTAELVCLAVDKSGSLMGYQYDGEADTVHALRGALDGESARATWQADGMVWEAGSKNLTEEVARMLVFRQDGWTQAWTIIRMPPLTEAGGSGTLPAPR